MTWRSFWIDVAVFALMLLAMSALMLLAMSAHPWAFVCDLLGVP